MSAELTNPIQALLQQAAKLPAETGATERYRARFATPPNGRSFILADTSGSMAYRVGSQRKIDILSTELNAVLQHPDQADTWVYSFATIVDACGIGEAILPEPRGSTALHLALDMISGPIANRTLVISDGQPDDKQLSLDAADRVTGRIDVLYIGPDDDHEAIAFMMALARRGGGSCVVNDIRRKSAAIAPTIQRLLSA